MAQATGGTTARASTRTAFVMMLLAGSTALLASACMRGREADDPSSTNQAGQMPQNGAYGAPQGGAVATQPGVPQGYGGQPGQAGQPGQPAVAAATSPFALPCQSDLVCGTHKCNMQVGRCSFPCASNSDCAPGFGCMGAGSPAAICIPGGGPPPAQQ
ncbi:MAG TPA: hypothetical protein VGM56_22060 [Byssovorax sp.]